MRGQLDVVVVVTAVVMVVVVVDVLVVAVVVVMVVVAVLAVIAISQTLHIVGQLSCTRGESHSLRSKTLPHSACSRLPLHIFGV